ncbi:MAG: methyltransferase [Pseudonocardiaceae bacterium]
MTDLLAKFIRIADIATPHAVRVAATLRLPQLISEGTTRLDELADQTRAHPDALGRVLRLLVLREVFTEPEPGTFGLTEIGRLLLDDAPFQLRAWLDLDGIGRADLAFGGLLKSVRTGGPAYQDVHGKPFWEDLEADHELSASFDALMEQNRKNTNPAILAGYDWESVDHVVDVGGGRGSLLEALLTAHPGMNGTLVDLPATAAFAKRRMAAAGLSGRCTVLAGSFFDQLPVGASAYLLSLVLHDWSDREAIRILGRCAEAAGADGRILLIERTNLDVQQSEDFIDMDLRMLVYYGGRERTLEEFHDLVAKAGLIIRRALYPPSRFSILECVNDGRS